MIFKRIANHKLWALFSLLFSAFIVLIILYAYVAIHLPNVQVLQDAHMQIPMRILSADGQLIAQYGSKKRTPITLDQVPKPLIQALLDTEDKRFYEHEGVDFIGIARAAVAVATSGRKVQGASTITMQVARNFFLTRKKSYIRKINEILLALKIEHNFSKDKILELYLNKVFFGNRAYGIAAAAQVYYGKKPKELTLAEMAMLAGLPQSPSRDNPLINPKGALDRRNHVLERMLANQDIDQATYDATIKEPITASYHEQRIQLSAPYVGEMVRQAIIKTYGKDAYQQGFTVVTTVTATHQRAAQSALQSGLIAYSKRHGYLGPEQHLSIITQPSWLTTIQNIRPIANLEPAVVIAVHHHDIVVLKQDGHQTKIDWDALKWARKRTAKMYLGPVLKQADQIVELGDVVRIQQVKKQWVLSQLPAVQGALVSMNPETGGILALDGGFTFNLSHFNRVTQAYRQAGSVFKPFLYSAALNKGYTLASIINDAPVVMKDTGEDALWRPNNDNFVFQGPTRLIVGLNQSRNLVSIRLLQNIGIPYARDYATRFGFDINKLPDAPSLALGSASLTPLSIAQGFGVFANGGYLVKPHLVGKILDSNNKIVYENNLPYAPNPNAPLNKSSEPSNAQATSLALQQHAQAREVITPQNTYLMNHALQTVIQQGTGRAARALGRHDLAGKTGTSNDFSDAWFAGFNTQNVTVTWVGFDNQANLREYGSQAALPIWMNYIKSTLAKTHNAIMPQPPGIINVRIDPKTGLLARPNEQGAIFELFRNQYAPKTYTTRPEYTRLSQKSIKPISIDDMGDSGLF